MTCTLLQPFGRLRAKGGFRVHAKRLGQPCTGLQQRAHGSLVRLSPADARKRSLRRGQRVSMRYRLGPLGAKARYAVGGGPVLVRDGKVVYREGVWPTIDVEKAKAEAERVKNKILSQL